MVVEQILCDLHPQLLLQLLVLRFVRICFCHIDISAFESNFDSLIKMVQDCINDYLSFLHHLYRFIKPSYLCILGRHDLAIDILFPSFASLPGNYGGHGISELLFVLFASVERIVNFKVN